MLIYVYSNFLSWSFLFSAGRGSLKNPKSSEFHFFFFQNLCLGIPRPRVRSSKIAGMSLSFCNIIGFDTVFFSKWSESHSCFAKNR